MNYSLTAVRFFSILGPKIKFDLSMPYEGVHSQLPIDGFKLKSDIPSLSYMIMGS